MNGAARSHPIPGLAAGSAVVPAGAAAAAALGALAVYSPKYAVFALLAGAFVLVAVSRPALAIALFVLLTFPEHLPGSLGAGATLAKPVGALIAIAWAGAALSRRGKLPLLPQSRPVLFAAIVGLLVFGAASTLWATDSSQVWSGLGRLLLVAALLVFTYTAASTVSGFRTIVIGFLLASVATSLYSIASGHSTTTGRLATLFDPNYFAAQLIPAIVIACFLFVTAGSARARCLFAAVAGIDLVAFVLTQSRGGIVGLAVGLLAAVVLAGRARPRILALVLVVGAVGLGYYFAYKPAHVFESGSRGGFSGTTSGRLDLWRVAFRVFAQHPLGGVGLGNFQVVEPSYATQMINLQYVAFIVKDRLVAHNTYLQLAAELGVVGLLLFLVILVLPLRLAWAALARLERQRSVVEFHVRGLLAGAIGMLAAYVFLSAEIEKSLWLILGLLAAVPAVLRSEAGQADTAGGLETSTSG